MVSYNVFSVGCQYCLFLERKQWEGLKTWDEREVETPTSFLVSIQYLSTAYFREFCKAFIFYYYDKEQERRIPVSQRFLQKSRKRYSASFGHYDAVKHSGHCNCSRKDSTRLWYQLSKWLCARLFYGLRGQMRRPLCSLLQWELCWKLQRALYKQLSRRLQIYL